MYNDSLYFDSLIAFIEGLSASDLLALEIRFEADSAALRDSIRMLVQSDSMIYSKVLSDSTHFQMLIDSIANMALNDVLLKELEARFEADSAALRDSVTMLLTLIDSLGLELDMTEADLLAKIGADSTYFEAELEKLRDSIGSLDNAALISLENRFVNDSINSWTQIG